MQAAILEFGPSAARFHRVHDDAVVDHLQRDDMGCGGEGGGGFRLVPDAEVEGAVGRGLGVDLGPAGVEREGDGAFVHVEGDQVGGIAGGVDAVGDDQGDGLAHEAHAAIGEDGARRGGAPAAVTVGDAGEAHADIDARRAQVLRGEDEMHAGGGAGGGDVQQGDVGMRAVRAEEPRPQRIFRRDIIDIAALPREEAMIFDAMGGLRLAEFHGRGPSLVSAESYAPGWECPAGGARVNQRLRAVRRGGQTLSDRTVAMANSPKPLKRVLVTVE